jgi:hypothetical protein
VLKITSESFPQSLETKRIFSHQYTGYGLACSLLILLWVQSEQGIDAFIRTAKIFSSGTIWVEKSIPILQGNWRKIEKKFRRCGDGHILPQPYLFVVKIFKQEAIVPDPIFTCLVIPCWKGGLLMH